MLKEKHTQRQVHAKLLDEYYEVFEKHVVALQKVRTDLEEVFGDSQTDAYVASIAAAESTAKAAQQELKAVKALLHQYGIKLVL